MKVDLLRELSRAAARAHEDAEHESAGTPQPLLLEHDEEDIEHAVRAIQQRLVDEHADLFERSLFEPGAQEALAATVERLIEEEAGTSAYRRSVLREAIIDRVVGLGPLQELMHDPRVTEIMVNAPDKVFVERHGRIEPIGSRLFRNDQEVLQLAQRIVARVGRTVNAEEPMVDARLSDGSRVNVVIPPVSEHVTITIRRVSREALSWDDLLRAGSISPEIIDLLEHMVRGKVNIVVAGGTGAGKTTLMRLLCGFIPAHERIITIEDVYELNLDHPNIVRMEAQATRRSRPIQIYDCMINALRMRPDRIIVGEMRGKEAIELLNAMGTGHPGSMTSVHSESPKQTITRIARMMLQGGYEIPYQEIIRQIHETVELIVYCRRLPDGSRKVTHVTEVLPDGTFVDLFRLVLREEPNGQVVYGFRQVACPTPRLVEKCLENGVRIPKTFLRAPEEGDIR